MNITKKEVQLIREELDELLDEYSKKKGIQLSIGTIRYDSNSFRTKLEGVVGESNEEVEKNTFESDCFLLGLKKEDYKKKFSFGGEQFVLIGIKCRSRRYPLLCVRTKDGKKFKLPLSAVKEEKESLLEQLAM